METLFNQIAATANPANRKWRVEKLHDRTLTITKFDNLEDALLFVKHSGGKKTKVYINEKTVSIQ